MGLALEHALGALHADQPEILSGAEPGCGGEAPIEVAAAHATGLRERANRQLGLMAILQA